MYYSETFVGMLQCVFRRSECLAREDHSVIRRNGRWPTVTAGPFCGQRCYRRLLVSFWAGERKHPTGSSGYDTAYFATSTSLEVIRAVTVAQGAVPTNLT